MRTYSKKRLLSSRRKRRFTFPFRTPPLAVLAGILVILLLSLVIFPAFSGKKSTVSPESSTSPALAPLSSVSPAQSPSPSPRIPTQQWPLLLVNSEYPLSEEYELTLSPIDGGNEQFDSRAIDAMEAMLSDMRKEGLSPLVCSAYRSRELQEELFEDKVRRVMAEKNCGEKEAREEAALWVHPPGVSEHESGLAADIVSMNFQVLEEAQEDTPEQNWLFEHCAQYGFILRYPKEKEELTGIGYEPWHYRYVGEKAAKEIMEQGLCLEEYLGFPVTK